MDFPRGYALLPWVPHPITPHLGTSQLKMQHALVQSSSLLHYHSTQFFNHINVRHICTTPSINDQVAHLLIQHLVWKMFSLYASPSSLGYFLIIFCMTILHNHHYQHPPNLAKSHNHIHPCYPVFSFMITTLPLNIALQHYPCRNT